MDAKLLKREALVFLLIRLYLRTTEENFGKGPLAGRWISSEKQSTSRKFV
jgi:hypothetical protein